MMRELKLMYKRLADFLIENIDFSGVSVVLEAGCGSGTLTIPFVKMILKIRRDFKFIAFDLSAGPYEDSLKALKAKIAREGLDKNVVAS